MMDKLLVYRCKHCGNMLIMVNKGGGAMTCCGSPLEAITPNTTDGAVKNMFLLLKMWEVNSRLLWEA